MTAPKTVAKKIIDALPEDSTYEEILKALAFDRMIHRGITDAKDGKTVPHKEVEKLIAKW